MVERFMTVKLLADFSFITIFKKKTTVNYKALYSSSLTSSHRSLEVFSHGTSTAICENRESFLAQCQCFTFAGITTTSHGFRPFASFHCSWYHPEPSTQIKIWPPHLLAWWICRLFLHHGSNVTLHKNTGDSHGLVSGLRYDCHLQHCAKHHLAVIDQKFISDFLS